LTTEEHIEKARHNEGFLSSFGDISKISVPFLDWLVTTIFYSALHYVDAILALGNVHPGKHSDRRLGIQRNKDLRVIWKDYRNLEDKSRKARYTLHGFSNNDIIQLHNRLNYLKNHILRRIKP